MPRPPPDYANVSDECKTRSGKVYNAIPILSPPSFDFGALLKEAVAEETCEPDQGEEASEDSHENEPQPAQEDLPARALKRPLSPAAPATSHSHQRRRRKRNKCAIENGQYPSARTVEAYVAPSTAVPTALATEDLPAAKGAYSAKNGKVPGAKKVWLVPELLKEPGFELEKWDGYTCRPLVDRLGRIYAILVGQPRDKLYAASARACHETLLEEGRTAAFRYEDCHHARGDFPAINVGMTYGKGSPAPVNLANRGHTELVERLLGHDGFDRLATFASSAFAMWAPKVYGYYKERVDALWNWNCRPPLKRIFRKSVFASAAFNFGPATRTHLHRDALNCPFGMCAIQALGDFDPTRGGHLILWEVKKVIEFPPGALILIPSATITHSNTPIQEGETRTSFTQYTAGALFRFVDNGFQTEAELLRKDPAAHARMLEAKEGRWEMGLGLLSSLAELKKRFERDG